jgi:hypothetical protein
MPELRRLRNAEPRIETGPIRFGDDWPGLFIRGDNAYALAHSILNITLKASFYLKDDLSQRQLKELDDLGKLLAECIVDKKEG